MTWRMRTEIHITSLLKRGTTHRRGRDSVLWAALAQSVQSLTYITIMVMPIMKRFKIAVAGTGYVGLSIAVLLSQHNLVCAVDILADRVEVINKRESPIRDEYIERYMADRNLNLTATLDAKAAYTGADYVVVAVPTDYDDEKGSFDTTAVDTVVKTALGYNPDSVIVIKSTVPVGYTESVRERTGSRNILFSPEFLREGNALYDSLYPSRIVIGADLTDVHLVEAAQTFAKLLQAGAEKENIPTLYMGYAEAEAVKLFSNTYLALRISFFNELDTYAEINGMDTKQIIRGICLDPRIGEDYNNPSFGYGGYCLPKDTKQLLTHYESVPENLIRAVVESNQTRKNFVANRAIELAGQGAEGNYGASGRNVTIGIYRLVIKYGSDNFRNSSIQDIISCVNRRGASVIIYEPLLKEGTKFLWGTVVNDLEKFKRESQLILANRYDICLDDVKDKVYTRDIYQRD